MSTIVTSRSNIPIFAANISEMINFERDHVFNSGNFRGESDTRKLNVRQDFVAIRVNAAETV
jgi:hypothetical protein